MRHRLVLPCLFQWWRKCYQKLNPVLDVAPRSSKMVIIITHQRFRSYKPCHIKAPCHKKVLSWRKKSSRKCNRMMRRQQRSIRFSAFNHIQVIHVLYDWYELNKWLFRIMAIISVWHIHNLTTNHQITCYVCELYFSTQMEASEKFYDYKVDVVGGCMIFNVIFKNKCGHSGECFYV